MAAPYFISLFKKFWPEGHVGILVPQPGIKPAPLQWTGRVLTSEPQESPDWL